MARASGVKVPQVRDRVVELRRVPASELRANPANWRRHPPSQIQALRSMIGEVGFAGAALAYETPDGLTLIDGHARQEIVGEAEIPVLVLDVTEAEAQLLLATFDPLAGMAQVDEAALYELLQSVVVPDEILAQALEEMTGQAGPPALTDPDEVPEVPTDPITKPGDLWLLGEHRLLCGDAADALDVLAAGASVDGIFTSPPYLQQRTYSGHMATDWDALMRGVFSSALSLLADEASVFVNLGLVHSGGVIRYWDSFLDWMESDEEMPLFGWYVWDKMDGMPGAWGGRLAPAHEWIFHFARAPGSIAKTVPTKSVGKSVGATQRTPDGNLKTFTGQGDPIQPFKIPDSVVRLPPQHGAHTAHPAVFPVALPETFMRAFPHRLWLDPFMGSGSSMIAAEVIGTSCLGVELNPAYCDVIVARWEAFTGKSAERG